jgi:hypothetical protein
MVGARIAACKGKVLPESLNDMMELSLDRDASFSRLPGHLRTGWLYDDCVIALALANWGAVRPGMRG